MEAYACIEQDGYSATLSIDRLIKFFQIEIKKINMGGINFL